MGRRRQKKPRQSPGPASPKITEFQMLFCCYSLHVSLFIWASMCLALELVIDLSVYMVIFLCYFCLKEEGYELFNDLFKTSDFKGSTTKFMFCFLDNLLKMNLIYVFVVISVKKGYLENILSYMNNLITNK